MHNKSHDRKQQILIGAGDGTVQLLNPKLISIELHKAKLTGAITSILLTSNAKKFYPGTNLSLIYDIEISTFKAELNGTFHFGGINNVKFPKKCSNLFVVAFIQDIQV
jgi:hypothetical protein